MVLYALLAIYSCVPVSKVTKIETLPSPSAYVKRGMTYFKYKDFERASAYFKKAIEFDGNYQPAHSYLALSYAHLGQNKNAILEFKKVVEIDPNTADSISSRKWLRRLSEKPTTIGVLSFHFAKRFKMWERNVPRFSQYARTISYQGLATEELVKHLKKAKMYKVVDLSNIDYSQIKLDYADEPPSSSELGKLAYLAFKNGAQLLLIPRIDYISVNGKPPYIKGNTLSLGLVHSGKITMSVAVYSSKSQKLIATVIRDSSKIPFLYGAASYVSGIQGLFKSCSEEVVKELLKQVL